MTDALYYAAAFNLLDLNRMSSLGTLTLKHAGESDIVITLSTITGTSYDSASTSYFWHWDNAGTVIVRGNDPLGSVRFPHFATTSFGARLQAAMNAAAGAWPTTDFQVQWLENNSGSPVPFYKLVYGSAFQFQFSTLAGARLLGHSDTSLSSSASTHFLGVPSYVVFPGDTAIACAGEYDALDKQRRGIASLLIADNGIAQGLRRSVAPKFRQWQQRYDAKSKIYRSATSGNPLCTFEGFYDYCGAAWPFYVANGGFANTPTHECFMFADDGNYLNAVTASDANHAQIHTMFSCLAVGAMESTL